MAHMADDQGGLTEAASDDLRAAERLGVLLMNTGSPAAPEPTAVRRYLARFLMDPCVRPMPALPWWLILHLFILPARGRTSAEKYRSIWSEEGSPLITLMERLASRVARVLAADAPGAAPVVRAAMTYGEPSARQALAALKEAGCARVVAIPLYPQSASSTTAPALASVRAALKELTWDPELITVEHYGDEPRYLDAVAETMREAGFDASRDQVLFSLHSIPQGDIDAGDTYQAQVEESCAAIMERLGASHTRWQISFQSPFPDQRTWCGPFSGDVIVELAREPRRTFVVCIGFAVDCLETLYDVEQKYRQRFAAEAVPGAELIYVPCLNDGDSHVELIAQLVRRAVDGRS